MSNDYEDFTAIVERYLAVEGVHTGWLGGPPFDKVEPLEFGFKGYVRADLLPGGIPGRDVTAANLRIALLARSEGLMVELAVAGFFPVHARLTQEFTSRYASPTVTLGLELVKEAPQYEVSLMVSCSPIQRFKLLPLYEPKGATADD